MESIKKTNINIGPSIRRTNQSRDRCLAEHQGPSRALISEVVTAKPVVWRNPYAPGSPSVSHSIQRFGEQAVHKENPRYVRKSSRYHGLKTVL